LKFFRFFFFIHLFPKRIEPFISIPRPSIFQVSVARGGSINSQQFYKSFFYTLWGWQSNQPPEVIRHQKGQKRTFLFFLSLPLLGPTPLSSFLCDERSCPDPSPLSERLQMTVPRRGAFASSLNFSSWYPSKISNLDQMSPENSVA